MRYGRHLGERDKGKENGAFESRKGSFGFGIRKAKVRPGNTARSIICCETKDLREW